MKLPQSIIKLLIGLALAAVLFISVPSAAAVVDCVTVTPATGGSAISADTYYTGTYTALTGPIVTEYQSGDVGTGTIILTAPSGFRFYTGSPAPTVLITRVSGSAGSGNNRMINHVASGTSVAMTSVTSTQLTFTVTYPSSSGTTCSLTWQNIKVIPTAGTPLASGNLLDSTSSTSTIAGVTKGSTNFGTLTEVAGSLYSITVSPSNPTVGVGGTQTYTAQGYDQYGNAVSTSVTWSVTNGTAGSINSSGVFTAGTAAGSYSNVIKATSGSISGTASVTVTAGSLYSITVSPSNPTVAVGGTQTYTAQGYDQYGNAVSTSVTWSVTNGTAGSINSSGVFTAGTAAGSYSNVIKATSGSISGTASVTVTANLPAAITNNATSVGTTIATLNGLVSYDGGENCQYRFAYGTSSGTYTYTTNWTDSVTTGQTFSVDLTGLGKGTKYYFVAQVKNSTGIGSGIELDFLTKPDPPSPFTATANSGTQINLTWTKGDGAQKTMIRRSTSGYPTDRSTGDLVYFDTGTSFLDTGLTPNTLYYYSAWSEVSGSEQWSDNYATASATTSHAPSATTNAATSVEETTATLNGAVASDGGESCQYRFEYGTSSGVYTFTTNWTGSVTIGQTFNANLTGLSEGTIYYYVAQVKNSVGTGTGAECNFLTKPLPPNPYYSSPAGSTKININWTKGDGAIRTMVRRSTGSYPADRNAGTLVYFDTGTYYTDTGLTPNTTYYYRAWSEVTINGVTQWSDTYQDTSATTAPPPTTTTPPTTTPPTTTPPTTTPPTTTTTPPTTTTTHPTTPVSVGGTIYPIDKMRLILPWLSLFGLILLVGGGIACHLIMVRNRRR